MEPQEGELFIDEGTTVTRHRVRQSGVYCTSRLDVIRTAIGQYYLKDQDVYLSPLDLSGPPSRVEGVEIVWKGGPDHSDQIAHKKEMYYMLDMMANAWEKEARQLHDFSARRRCNARASRIRRLLAKARRR